MKIILSRKGFDSNAGGKPSIIYNDKFYSIPIPEAGSGIFYKDLIFDDEHSYLDVMRDLGIKFYSEAHLDPDLRRDILPNRDVEWRPLFGQDDKSQSRLSKTFAVEPGNIILFFGNFQKIIKRGNKFKYSELPPYHKKDIQIIFGYSQVDEIIDISTENRCLKDWMKYHPHISYAHFYHSKYNSLYVSKLELSVKESIKKSINGSGYFKYAEELILTAPNETKSKWLLPPCFEELDIKKFGINTSKIKPQKINSRYKIQLTGIGSQEIFCTNKPSIVNWAIELISKNASND